MIKHLITDNIFIIIIICVLQCANSTMSMPDVSSTERRAMRISEHNNSLYVRDLVRSAKAAELRNYIDRGRDPCRNFFQFACGNWVHLQPPNIRNKFKSYTTDVMMNAYNHKISNLLQNQNIEEGELDANDVKVKNFYEACVQMRNWSTSRNRKKLRAIIDEFGEMPAIIGMYWDHEGFDWLATVAKISRKYGIDIILRMAIQPDIIAINPIYRIYMHIPETLLHARKNNMYYLLNELLGIDMSVVDTLVPELQEIEMLLKPENGRDITEPNLFTVDQLQQQYLPLIDLSRYLALILGQNVSQETIYEISSEHHKRIARMLRKTDKRKLANYIFYKLIDSFQIPSEYTARKQAEKCATRTYNHFGKNIDNMLYRKYNNVRTERDLNVIWNRIKDVMRTKFTSSPHYYWINDITREQAIDKLDAMRLEINTFERELQDDDINELNFSADDYIENMRTMRELQQRKHIAKWQQTAKLIFEITYNTPRLFPKENVIRVPVSFLQPHMLWDEHYPFALKFATLGTMIAHELVHGFDELGQAYDKNGMENSWWDAASQKRFFDHVDCFDEQFEQYLKATNIRPKLLRRTLQPEIVAENGAVAVAFLAYKHWYNDLVAENITLQTELELLPNVGRDNMQLFFISYAQQWCENREIWSSIFSMDEDLIPAEFRVNSALQNMNSFGRAFECVKSRDFMHPLQKCKIY